MRILLTGPTGQVGSALLDTLPSMGEVVPLDRSELDLASAASIRAAVREVRPQVIVNAAAYTAVDKAESEETLAYRVNAEGPAVLAQEAAHLGALLVQFSTDYVFDGEKTSPYVECDEPSPLNVYGHSKAKGDTAIVQSGCRHLILRTSWIYAPTGKNFLLTMLRLAREGKALRVVDDQRGAPTSNLMIAQATGQALARVLTDSSLGGTYHMSAGGSTTWHGFARAAFQEQGIAADLTPISSAQYPSPARRPRNSVLDNSKLAAKLGVRLPTWEAGLREVICDSL